MPGIVDSLLVSDDVDPATAAELVVDDMPPPPVRRLHHVELDVDGAWMNTSHPKEFLRRRPPPIPMESEGSDDPDLPLGPQRPSALNQYGRDFFLPAENTRNRAEQNEITLYTTGRFGGGGLAEKKKKRKKKKSVADYMVEFRQAADAVAEEGEKPPDPAIAA
ncbi:hypothetical protein GGR56DRAFT_670088 [Xylariaceae sp. FL0804]|nr:hypothetical protein GGR56DRAFT_670088 [Xylariaceae sp. FL0804]